MIEEEAFEAVISESNDNIHHRLLSNIGTEFKGNLFDNFFKIDKITKHICTKSYSPELHIARGSSCGVNSQR